MSHATFSLDLPGLLQAQVSAAREIGLYANESALIADAIQMLFAARPDVQLATACQLYQRGSVSLGKAAELAGCDLSSFKRALAQHGIARTAPESLAETTALAQVALQITGQAD